MAGPYAHITLLHELIQPARLERTFSSTLGLDAILVDYFAYSVLGAVSPDYPNLARDSGIASQWADAMHSTRACEMITSGIRRVRVAEETVRNKQLAWLLGYCAHVVTDATIHPIVQAKVGVYAENKRHHRICEMNQDSYIYQRMNLGEIGESEHFALNIARCGDPDDRMLLDRDIVVLWEGMLEDVHSQLFVANPPDSTSWHRQFIARSIDHRAGEMHLFPLASVISTKVGLAYPQYKKVSRQYSVQQLVPSDCPYYLDYDDIFDQAADNVAAVWKLVEQAVYAADISSLPIVGNWDLDSGRDEHGKLVFWE